MNAHPPLLMLAEGRKPRLRKPPVWRPKESKLQTDVANTLREHCLKDWRWTHFPAGEKRDARTGARLKRFGLHRGWPDFLLVSPAPLLHCLELKRSGLSLTDDQEEFRGWCDKHGVPYVVSSDFGQVLAVLDAWRCLRIKL